MNTQMPRLGLNDVDFDLHGLVGIRLQNPSYSDVAAVRRQLGPIEKPLEREPDIVIRFVDRLAVPATLRLLGVEEAGFTKDAFLVLRGKNKSQARVMIPIDQIGQRCEIICETGLAAVPLLIAIINLTALNNGALPLHASAFIYNGIGALATGWSKGGKTESLLAMMAHGARYIADEWVYLHGDGRMSGIPEPIRVWDWHLASLPQYRASVSRGGLMRLRALRMMQLALKCVPGGRWPSGQFKRRLSTILKRQSYSDIAAARLFGRQQLQLEGELNKIFFVVSHASPEIRVDSMDTEDIAQRMVQSLQFEQSDFMGFYRMFRFAFPDRANDLIEQTEMIQTDLLRAALANKDAYAIAHPYPVSLQSLFEAIAPLCRPSTLTSARSPQLVASNGGTTS